MPASHGVVAPAVGDGGSSDWKSGSARSSSAEPSFASTAALSRLTSRASPRFESHAWVSSLLALRLRSSVGRGGHM
eukprot:6438148-Prymnesium_polylepis.1